MGNQHVRIGVIYEHPHWFQGLFQELARRQVETVKIFAGEATLDPIPADVEFDLAVNRVSPSSHTRGHGNSVFFARAYLEHLEGLGVPTVNGTQPYELEISKAKQTLLLQRLGLRYPRTVVVNHLAAIPVAVRKLRFPVMTKANIGGSGAGILLFHHMDELQQALARNAVQLGVDQTLLLQEYHPAAGGFIVRVEFLDGRFLYAIKVESDPEAGFNLCPADVCEIPAPETKAFEASFCPVNAPAKRKIEAFEPPADAIADVLRIAKAGNFDVGGIEYLISARDGQRYIYDINALSNFVADAPNIVGFDPTVKFVDYLIAKAARHRGASA